VVVDGFVDLFMLVVVGLVSDTSSTERSTSTL
jgi:hypothetical protein